MKNLLEIIIKLYQNIVSPWTRPACRFLPTCSSFAIEALNEHGVIKGTAMTIWRILRCNPFSTGGYDPVTREKEVIIEQKVYKGVEG